MTSKMTKVKIRGTLEVRYEQTVELNEKDMSDLKKLFNREDDRGIGRFCFDSIDVHNVHDSEDELSDAEVYIIGDDGKLQCMYSGEDYEVEDDDSDED